MTKYQIINGWTKERIIQRLEERMPEKGQCIDIERNACIYFRESDSKCCAVGALLDEVKDYATSNYEVRDLIIHFPELRERLPLPSAALRTLQIVHDGWYHGPVEGTPRDLCIKWIEENTYEN